MFSQMINKLGQGQFPEKLELKKRLQIALVKKMGILKQPYLFWPQDPKINPPAQHLLWAAVLLEDHESFSLAADILYTEKLETGKINTQEELVAKQLNALLVVAKSDEIKEKIRRKIKTIQNS